MDARITEFSGNDEAILAQDPATLDAAGQANYKNVTRFHNAPLQMSAPHLANLWTRYNFTQDGLARFLCRRRRQLRVRSDPLAGYSRSAHQTYTLVNATGRLFVGSGRTPT